MSTELVTLDNGEFNALAALGIGESDRIDIRSLQLVHAINSAEVGVPAGHFYDSEMQVSFPKMTIIPLTIGGLVPRSPMARSKMPPKTNQGFVKGTKPMCKSNDGINPVNTPEMPRLDGGLGCARCKYSQSKTINGVWIPPECGENYYFTFMDAETQFVYRMLLKKTAVSAIKAFRKKLSDLTKMASVKGGRFVYFENTVEMTAPLVKKNGNNYHNIAFGLPKFVEDDNLREAARLAYIEVQKERVYENDEDEVDQAIGKATEGNDFDNNVPFDIEA